MDLKMTANSETANADCGVRTRFSARLSSARLSSAGPSSARLCAMVCLVATAALSGCRAEEQGRVTQFEKGVYQGQADEAIGPEVKDALSRRAQKQSF